MQPIPSPQVLDPDRILANDRGDFTIDHEARAQLLEEALHETCGYAQQLWRDLDAVRSYLLDSLPPDPRSPGQHLIASAAPTGPDDEDGWTNWITAFAAVTSVLCGPHGDSGYGLGEARHQAALRRSAPVLRIRADHAQDTSATNETSISEETEPAPASGRRSWPAHTATTIVLGLFALRGLRPRRGSAQ